MLEVVNLGLTLTLVEKIFKMTKVATEIDGNRRDF